MKANPWILIDELLPADPLGAEVVLHVRRHLRHRLRSQESRGWKEIAEDLALLFGRAPEDAAVLRRAARSSTPIADAAAILGDGGPAVALGHDADHLERCRQWLIRRKDQDDEFQSIVATDLATLLALSRARDLAGEVDGEDGSAPAVLITGETGTGKELLASALHALDGRGASGKHPWVPVQVAGMPVDLISSELFGHAKGAFTGASQERRGRVEEADHGTLFIDEVGDLPQEAQVRLLRFLQDQRFSRVGESPIREVRTRILAATLHDLDALEREKRFRIDLLHRLRVGWLHLPPLRQREGFWRDGLEQMLRRQGHKADPLITRSARDALATYPWPGNLRELHSILRLALRSAMGATIRLEDLPSEIQRPYLARPLHERAPGFLCDEVEDQRLSPELISWRVSEIAEQLDKYTPLPDAAEMPDRLALSLRQIPDSDPAHLALVAALDELLDLDRQQRRLQRLHDTWISILEAVEGPVADAARLCIAEIHGRSVALAEESQRRRSAIDINTSPWVRLWAELMRHPFGKKEDPTRLLGHLVNLAEFLHGLSPDWFHSLRAIVEEGGIRLLITKLWELLKANAEGQPLIEQEPDPAKEQRVRVAEILARPHKAWSKDDWRLLLASFESKVALSKYAGIDTKTVTRYLRKHGLNEVWGVWQDEVTP